MSTPTYPPRKVNDVANSIFNSSDYTVVGNDLKYVKLSGSTMTGALSCVGLTSASGTNTLGGTVSLTGAISLKSNVTLPTVYNASPNTLPPTINQRHFAVCLHFEQRRLLYSQPVKYCLTDRKNIRSYHSLRFGNHAAPAPAFAAIAAAA